MEQATEDAPGWVVVDPDGNIVDSGPGIVLEMAAQAGDSDQEGLTDGSD